MPAVTGSVRRRAWPHHAGPAGGGTRDLGEQGGTRPHRRPQRHDARPAHHGADIARLRGRLERDDDPAGPGPRGPAGPVHVGLVLGWRVGVDDQVDPVHVDAPGGDVGGDQDADRAGRERGQVPLASALGQVAVQFGRRDGSRAELVGELARGVLGPREHRATVPGRRPARSRCRGGRQRRWSARGAPPEAARRPGRPMCTAGLDMKRRTRTSTSLIERGGEQQPLAVSRGGGQQAPDDRQEPRSAMWSASSSTVTSTSPRWQWPCSIRSASRPGQATTMSARLRSAATCLLCGVPP